MSQGITGTFRNMKMGTKILIICMALVIIPTTLLGVVAYNSASGAVEDQIERRLTVQSHDIEGMADGVYTLTMELVQSGLNVLRYNFNSHGTPEIRDGQLVLVNAGGQVYIVNDNHEVVDGLARQFDGAAATIFQVQGNQAIRVSTSIYGADGRRVVGTPVAQDVYTAVVSRGETFYGTANVVGREYITVYEPIRGPGGAIIGILFVGIPEETSLGVLKEEIRRTVIGENGYVFVVNSQGTLLVHPTIEGDNLGNEDFIKRIISQGEGVIHYQWNGVDRIAGFAYFAPLDWHVVGAADVADFTGPIDEIRNAILAIVIGAIIIGGGIAIFFGRSIARRMDELVALGRRVTDGDLSGTVKVDGSGDEIGQVASAFGDVVTTIQRFGSEMNTISAAAAEGRLDVRGDAGQFKGDYGRIIGGVNETLDSVIGPLNVAAEYVERISNGDVPEKITDEYKGDFNEIKNNLNKCIDAVDLLVRDANMLVEAAVEGRLDTRADATKHQGDFRAIVEGVNETLNAVVGPLNMAAEYVERISNGDIPEKITDEYKGDFNEIKNNLNKCINAVDLLVADADMLAKAAVDGMLATRADATKHQGDFRKIVAGVNETLDSVIGPLNVAAKYVNRISNGDIPEKITDTYNGDFNEIKNNLNKCIDAVNLLVGDANVLVEAAVEGRLDTRADATKHQGDFRAIVEGVNDTLDAVIGPLNVAAEYVDRISNGDIPEKITDEYKGDFNEIKNNLNKCINAVNLLVADAEMLAKAAVDGKLATRADATKHQGDFRKIVAGVNNTLDAVITPVNEVIRLADSFANADFSTRFSEDVNARGDLEKLKNAMNNVSTQISLAVADVSRMMEELAATSEEASAGVEEVASGSQQVARNTGKVSENSEKANNGARQVLRAMEDLSAAVEEVTSNAESVAAIARNADEQSKEGAKLAAAAEKGIGEISTSASDVDAIIKDINDQMNQIGKIVGLIADISNQTNLLALNAAIEAARAGDAGRGFAVVAAEVKSLAQESGSSAESIASMIGELQTKAKRAVDAMGTANTAVEAGSDQMEQTIKAFNQIVDSVEKISRAIEEVASAAEEQAATVEEITASVHEVTGLIEENAREAGDAAAATEEASASIDEITRMIENVSDVANKTLQMNQKFKLAK
ncbi:Cache 3/Cache 2 fusion domain-containing protein [Methanocalculus chunghsingensis]|uniref:Cache 3/Cache 2 fusion domain-containing protein n=1 Tax=Methanocalculus chunghsingensis TaxID=156457 RepID=UPI001B8D8FBA|nr:Cache 3/Cache 2 fusion domain-containing protein [Methanocalculus chunghsingensis]